MSRKTIALPGFEDVDITPIIPLLDTHQFQRLHFIRQLGLSFMTFPAANHTRFEHSLGVYALTRQRTGRWKRDGSITPDQAINLRLYGLLHDIGHGPYSHVTERLCHLNHKQRGEQILDELHDPIKKCGGNPQEILSLFQHTNPLACCVSDRPLGTDKLDYLLRDARYTHDAVRFRLGDLLNHVSYQNQELVADIRISAEVAQAQLDYVYMHDRVYFRKPCLIAQHFFEKIVARAMQGPNGITEKQLSQYTDDELNARLFTASDPIVIELFHRSRQRHAPEAAITLVPEHSINHERVIGKDMATFHIPLTKLNAFNWLHLPARATQLETEIAQIANVPSHAILVIPVTETERFVPKDITIVDGSTRRGTLRELRPAHHQNLLAIAQACAAIRVCTFGEYRQKISGSSLAREIFKHLMSQIN